MSAINKKDMNRDFKIAMSFFGRLRCWIVLGISKHIMDFKDVDGFYIQDLCVDSVSRGRGIGSRLLEYCIADNEEKGTENIFLDLESDNQTAFNLYRKLKFELFRETNIKFAGVTLYRMRRVINK